MTILVLFDADCLPGSSCVGLWAALMLVNDMTACVMSGSDICGGGGGGACCTYSSLAPLELCDPVA